MKTNTPTLTPKEMEQGFILVRCIDNKRHRGELKKGKVYKAKQSAHFSDCYEIEQPGNLTCSYYKSKFQIVTSDNNDNMDKNIIEPEVNNSTIFKLNLDDDRYKRHQAIQEDTLYLCPVTIDEQYRKQLGIIENDFVVLMRGNMVVSNSLYRIGGLSRIQPFQPLNNMPYFMLLKHVEAHYPSDFIKLLPKGTSPKNLESRWCILNNAGIEKKEFTHHQTVYLVNDSCIYIADGEYRNIETGELYTTYSNSRMESSEYLFLEKHDGIFKKRGIIKINKSTGTWEVFE